MRIRWLSVVLLGGASALLLACSAAYALASEAGPAAAYRGTTAAGGTVEFDLTADGATVTRFAATQVPDTCGAGFDGEAQGAFPITGDAFSKEGPGAGLVFAGALAPSGSAEGTVAYRIFRLRADGCESTAVAWTASVVDGPVTPSVAPPSVPEPPVGGPAGTPVTSGTHGGPLITYRQEGGIGGPRPSLVVSRGRRVLVTMGSCKVRSKLGPAAWTMLRAAIGGARLGALAGDYPPPPGSADMITYVIRTRAGTVRIAPSPDPRNEEVMGDLAPLLKVLDGMVSRAQRRMPASCRRT
jgi:hypothetical protein